MISMIFTPPQTGYTFSGPTPSGHVFYETSTLITSAGFLKSYHILKLYTNSTLWLQPIYQKQLPSFSTSLNFAIRADLKQKPLIIIVPSASITLLLSGYYIRNMERGYTADSDNVLFFKYASNGWWNSIITMTTVGYGDVYPKTDTGRALIFFTALIGLVLISLYVAALNNTISFDRQEFLSYLEIRNARKAKNRENRASDLIKFACFMKRAREKGMALEMCIFGMHLKKVAQNFSGLKNQEKYVGPSEILMKIEKKIESEVGQIKKSIFDVEYVGEKLKNLQIEQKTLENDLREIFEESNRIYSKVVEYNLKYK
jgi:hypothetical protein